MGRHFESWVLTEEDFEEDNRDEEYDEMGYHIWIDLSRLPWKG